MTARDTLADELTRARDRTLRLVDFDDAELRRQYDFEDLSSFLELYYATMDVLRGAADFEALTRAYLDRAAGQGLRRGGSSSEKSSSS